MSGVRRIVRPYRVRFDEAGPDGNLRTSGFLRFASDLAWEHSERVGFGRDWYASRGLMWLIRAIDLEVTGEVPYSAEVTVSTEVVGVRRVWARRRSEIVSGGLQVATAHIDWVLLGPSGTPVRVPDEIGTAFVDRARDFTPLRLDRSAAPDHAARLDFVVRARDLDPMGHVNNATYIDYADDLLAADGPSGVLAVPRRYQAEFVASATPAALLTGYGWTSGGTWRYRLEDDSGSEIFRATVEPAPTTPAGG